MSEYTDFSYDYAPSVSESEVAEAAGLNGSRISGSSNATGVSVRTLWDDFVETVRDLESQDLPSVEARLEALEQSPLLTAATLNAGGRPLLELAMDQGSGNRSQGITGRALEKAVNLGRQQLLVAEATVLHGHITAELREMGRSIEQPRRPIRDAVSIKGTNENGTAVSVKISPKTGRILLDLSGFHDGKCQVVRQRLVEGLRKRKVFLKVVSSQRHDSRQGGRLTQEINEVLGEKPQSRPRIKQFQQTTRHRTKG